MKILGTTMVGHSQYDDRLWDLLNSYSDLDAYSQDLPAHPVFEGVDHIGLLSFMVLAGASVRSEWLPEGDMVQMFIEIPEAEEERFYVQLERHLTEARGSQG